MATGLSYILQVKGLNFVEAGKIVGVSKQTVFKWANGLVDIAQDRLDLFVKEFNTDEALITGELDKALKAKILYREIELITMGR